MPGVTADMGYQVTHSHIVATISAIMGICLTTSLSHITILFFLTAITPFFCLAHEVGFVSRIGLIDHVSGTHKVPLEYAASICPEEWGGCLFDGY